MNLLICKCEQCKGFHSTRRSLARTKRKGGRSRQRVLLRQERYDELLVSVDVGYTDLSLYPQVVDAGLIHRLFREVPA